MNKWLNEISLKSKSIKLIPLRTEHSVELNEAAKDGELWNLWYTSVPKPNHTDEYIQKAITDYNNDISLPFSVVHLATNKIIGTTRYMNAFSAHKRLEIGGTWYAASYQRTSVNTECKYLLLKYAFETLDCMAVELRTHWYNITSRNAIARIGAKQDGVLRNHQIDKSGNIRDTVVFSIIDSEWKRVKNALEYKMNKYK